MCSEARRRILGVSEVITFEKSACLKPVQLSASACWPVLTDSVSTLASELSPLCPELILIRDSNVISKLIQLISPYKFSCIGGSSEIP